MPCSVLRSKTRFACGISEKMSNASTHTTCFFPFNAHLLSSGRVFPDVEVYGYLTRDQRRIINGMHEKLAVDTAAVVKSMLSADAVVLEVVETAAIDSGFITRTLEMLEAEATRVA